MITLKFPQHIRNWIAENKGNVSPARFLYMIIEEHYLNTISFKEKQSGRNTIHHVREGSSENP